MTQRRRTIIAGNWKMHKNIAEAISLANGLKRELCEIDALDIVICPPFTALADVAEVIYSSNIQLGAQNSHWEKNGAFTGEVSPIMLKDVGCKYVIAGHSERRHYFGETDDMINSKIKAILELELYPIFCLGERLEEREEGKTFNIIQRQLENGLKSIDPKRLSDIIIAYEPVWAIGTGKTATCNQAEEAHKFIRDCLEKNYGQEISSAVRIQYGGSVKPENVTDLINQDDIDGALVGGASLNVGTFSKIIKNSL